MRAPAPIGAKARFALGTFAYALIGNSADGGFARCDVRFCKRDQSTNWTITLLLTNLPATPISLIERWLPELWKLRNPSPSGSKYRSRTEGHMFNLNRVLICALALLFASHANAFAQTANGDQLRDMNNRITALENWHFQVESGGGGAVAFVAGAVCALWAQNTGRSPWLWFFLGLFFNCITLLVLLSKNARDLALRKHANG